MQAGTEAGKCTPSVLPLSPDDIHMGLFNDANNASNDAIYPFETKSGVSGHPHETETTSLVRAALLIAS